VTYTTAYRDYEAETFEAAAAAMLRDPDIWDHDPTHGLGRIEPGPETDVGNQTHYLVHSWTWDGKRLRVWFR
jgi:hypothetical protein